MPRSSVSDREARQDALLSAHIIQGHCDREGRLGVGSVAFEAAGRWMFVARPSKNMDGASLRVVGFRK